MVIKMRSLGISAISIVLTAAVVGNAYYQKKQFYPSVVYITKSNPSMTVSSFNHLIGFAIPVSLWHFCSRRWEVNKSLLVTLSLDCRSFTCNRWSLSSCWENWWEKYVRRFPSIFRQPIHWFSFWIDFPRDTACGRIRAPDGTILVRVDWNMFGIYRLSGRF